MALGGGAADSWAGRGLNFLPCQNDPRSKQNHSHTPRPVFINRYRRPDDYAVIRATTTSNRAEAEKLAQDARRENEPQGLMVRGFRPYAGSDEVGTDGAR